MKKKYYDRKKEKYIVEKLKSTPLDKEYIPLIADIIMRRQYEFEYGNDILDRDLNTFINNVQHINAGVVYDKQLGEMNFDKKEIILSDRLFGLGYDQIYATLAHEVEHAMRFVDGKDRTYRAVNDDKESDEIFTESTSSRLIYDIENSNSNEKPLTTRTVGYLEGTPYIDVIAATYGVDVKDVLKAGIEGEASLKKIPEDKGIADEKKYGYMDGILYATTKLVQEKYTNKRAPNIENIKFAVNRIEQYSTSVLLERLNGIDTDNIDEFKEIFEKLKLEIIIVDDVLKNTSENEKIKRDEYGINGHLKYKINCIEEILNNDNITNKTELINSIQQSKYSSTSKSIMQENGIVIDENQEIEVSKDLIQEYNERYSSNNMEWDNSKIAKYIEKNRSQLSLTRVEKALLKAEKGSKNTLGNFIKNIGKKIIVPFTSRKGKTLLLPETTETQPTKKGQSWDLANWDIDKDKFIEENQSVVEGYINKESGEIEKKSMETDKTQHDER